MNTGVERAEAQPQVDSNVGHEGEAAFADSESLDFQFYDAQEDPGGGASKVIAGLLIALAIGWIGASGYALWQTWPGPGPELAGWTDWLASFCAPLVLIALLWLMIGRTSRRETERFTNSVAEMRREAQALESVLAIVADRLVSNRAALSDEAARLMSLGDEASDRLGRVTHFLSREAAELDRRAQALDSAAAAARVDIGTLMADLPRAEAQANAVAEAMKGAGFSANEQSAALEGRLSAVIARSREADEVVGGAAQRLAAHIGRIESSTGAAAERMDQTAAQMNAAVDDSMNRAAESVDQARAGLEAQGQAMLAMVEQGRAAFESAGAEASTRLSEQLGQLGSRMDWFASRLAEQEAAGQALVATLSAQLGDLDAQLGLLGSNGAAQNDRLSQSVASLREAAAALHAEVGQGSEASAELIGRTSEMAGLLSGVTNQLRSELPEALANVESQAERTSAAAQAAIPSVQAIQDIASAATASLAEGETIVARQQQAVESLLGGVRDASASADEQLRALGAAIGETDESAVRLAQQTAPHLIDTLVRVREAANQAAAHVREAIAAAIPDSVAALANASREAVSDAVTEPMQDQLAEIAAAAQRATTVARAASERLTRQLLVIGETAAAIEDRIAEDRAEREEKAAEHLTRRVSLLIEALNSTAIDVNKILSNDVADNAWAAYLKGDRGVFTRRAVRLLDSGEAREILRHYEEEPDFRDQVNRYVGDFESMLRRVLGDRDGSTIAVTLLSSDMGKLYVALGQAIERFRR